MNPNPYASPQADSSADYARNFDLTQDRPISSTLLTGIGLAAVGCVVHATFFNETPIHNSIGIGVIAELAAGYGFSRLLQADNEDK